MSIAPYIAPITWEATNYRSEHYDGYFTNAEGARLKRLDEETAVIHWGKWEYYSVAAYKSVEDYKNGEEDYGLETPCYVGLDEEFPDYTSRDALAAFLLTIYGEGCVLEIHPRRYAGVEFSLVDGEVNWDTWDNGESFVDATYIIQDGKCIVYEDEEE